MTILIITKNGKLICKVETCERTEEIARYYTNLGCTVEKA